MTPLLNLTRYTIILKQADGISVAIPPASGRAVVMSSSYREHGYIPGTTIPIFDRDVHAVGLPPRGVACFVERAVFDAHPNHPGLYSHGVGCYTMSGGDTMIVSKVECRM